MQERVLVTGGAGFIGSHLAEALVASGRRVTALDDFSTGRFDNIAHLQGDERFALVAGSICDRQLVEELARAHDKIFHLAAVVGVRNVIEDPVRTIETNIAGTETVLEYAARYARPTLVASTSEVYGKSEDLPFREDGDCVLGPSSRRRWAYACSKLLDEFLALAYRLKTGLPVVIARLFNVVGPRQTGRYGMVLPTFVGQALRGEPLTVYGDGTQRRTFCDVQDVVPALLALMDSERARGEVVNLGGTQAVSMNELARLVLEVTGSSSQVVHVPYDRAYPAGFEDMQARVPDISKAERLVGFRPGTDLRHTIARVAAAMRDSARS